jgi:hypothetical protein
LKNGRILVARFARVVEQVEKQSGSQEECARESNWEGFGRNIPRVKGLSILDLDELIGVAMRAKETFLPPHPSGRAWRSSVLLRLLLGLE